MQKFQSYSHNWGRVYFAKLIKRFNRVDPLIALFNWNISRMILPLSIHTPFFLLMTIEVICSQEHLSSNEFYPGKNDAGNDFASLIKYVKNKQPQAKKCHTCLVNKINDSTLIWFMKSLAVKMRMTYPILRK